MKTRSGDFKCRGACGLGFLQAWPEPQVHCPLAASLFTSREQWGGLGFHALRSIKLNWILIFFKKAKKRHFGNNWGHLSIDWVLNYIGVLLIFSGVKVV